MADIADTKQIIQSSAWAGAAKVLAAVSGLAVSVLLARSMPSAAVGEYFLAISIVTIGVQVCVLGLDRVAVRFIAEGMATGRPTEARRATGLALRLSMAWTALCVALFLIARKPLLGGVFHSELLLPASLLLAGLVWLSALQHMLTEVFRGYNDIRTASLTGGLGSYGTGIVLSILMPTGLAIVWVLDMATLHNVIALTVLLGGLTVFGAGMVLLGRTRHGLPPDGGASGGTTVTSWQFMVISLPLFVTNFISTTRQSMSIWLLSACRPPEEVAVYGQVLRLTLLVALVGLISTAVVPPLIAGLHAQGKKEQLERILRGITTVTSIPAVAALLVFVFFGRTFLGAVFGDAYSGGALALCILSFSTAVFVAAGPASIALMMTGHERPLMVINLVATVFLLGAGLLAARWYGFLGVATVYAIQGVGGTVATWLVARKKIGVWTHASLSPKPLLRAVKEAGNILLRRNREE